MPCSQAGVRGLRGRRASGLFAGKCAQRPRHSLQGSRWWPCSRGWGGDCGGPASACRSAVSFPLPLSAAARAWCHRQEPTARRRPPGGQRPVFPLHRHVESPLGSCRPRVGTVRVSGGGAVPEGHRCGPCFVRAENTAPPPPAVGSVWPASPLLTDEETEAQRASDSPAG